jgi:hypothetical protein
VGQRARSLIVHQLSTVCTKSALQTRTADNFDRSGTAKAPVVTRKLVLGQQCLTCWRHGELGGLIPIRRHCGQVDTHCRP